MSTYRPITFTPYDPDFHASVSKTVFTGIQIATDDVDDFILRGTPAPSTLVHWGSPDLSFSVSEITQDDGEVVHQIGLATGELYAMARDGLFINSNDFGESFFTDQMFVDITAPTLGESSRLYEMTLDNTDFQQQNIYLYSIAGDELFDGNTPSAQEMNAFVADVETNGTYVLADLQRATPSEADLATTTVITDMPVNNYEWADEYYDYLWNPLDDSRITTGSVNLTIPAADLMAGDAWAVSLPFVINPDGQSDLGSNLKIDFWIDINTDDLFIQILGEDNVIAGTLRVEDYYQFFPLASEISDFWELTYHPLSLVDFVTQFGNLTSTLSRQPFKNGLMLPAPEIFDEDSAHYTLNSFRDMQSFDATSGAVVFGGLNQTYTGGSFESNFLSEPGDTTYVEGPDVDSYYFKGDIRYENATDAIRVDFASKKVLDDGWGYVDDFSKAPSVHINGSIHGDEFFNLVSASLSAERGNDWIHSFAEGGSYMSLGRGYDFVDASGITDASPNALNATSVFLVADDIWDAGYYAFNASDADHVGTGDLISLDGYRQIQDVVFGSADGNIQIEIEYAYDYSNELGKGIALFVDDMLTARHVESGQASDTRLKDIAEIHTTILDDIIDLTSSYHADQTGNVKVYGLAGDDILWGGSSNENLDGGNGVDLINGGVGDDTLTGDSGADIFEFTATSGNDTITDFSVEDVLKFYRRSTDTNDAVIDEANRQVMWQADGHTVTIDFVTDIAASNVTIE